MPQLTLTRDQAEALVALRPTDRELDRLGELLAGHDGDVRLSAPHPHNRVVSVELLDDASQPLSSVLVHPVGSLTP